MVIIGLIVGGVLVGQDLIEVAKIRKQINQITQLQTSVAAFQVKYGCLPGDCPTVRSSFGTTDANGNIISNGDGNGLIQSQLGSGGPWNGGDCINADPRGEVTQLFLHLNLGGFGLGPSDGATAAVNVGYPRAVAGNGLFVTCLSSASGVPCVNSSLCAVQNTIVLGAVGINTRLQYATGLAGAWALGNPSAFPMGIPENVAWHVDEKMDDGLPNLGSCGVIAQNASSPCLPSTSTYLGATPGCPVTFGCKM